jgi:hypothetical protein
MGCQVPGFLTGRLEKLKQQSVCIREICSEFLGVEVPGFWLGKKNAKPPYQWLGVTPTPGEEYREGKC